MRPFKFFRNVGKFLPHYVAPHRRRSYSSVTAVIASNRPRSILSAVVTNHDADTIKFKALMASLYRTLINGKLYPEQAMKPHMGSRGITLLFL